MNDSKFLFDTISRIHEDPNDAASLNEMAAQAGYSPNHFNALFLRYTGYTAAEYARVYRLTRSAAKLRTTEKSVLEIALNTGYDTAEGYERAFKSYYGQTPSQYRLSLAKTLVVPRDYSGRLDANVFARLFPQMRRVSLDLAIDSIMICHRPAYDADLIELFLSDCAIFTLDGRETPEHFVIVKDYARDEMLLDVVCNDETTARGYLWHTQMIPKRLIGFTMPPQADWLRNETKLIPACKLMNYAFQGQAAAADEGYNCRELAPNEWGLLEKLGKACGRPEDVRHCITMLGKQTHPNTPRLMVFGAFAGSGVLVGAAIPGVHPVRDLVFADVGDVLVDPSKTDPGAGAVALWNHTARYALGKGWIPCGFRVPCDAQNMDTGIAKRSGYTPVSVYRSYRA